MATTYLTQAHAGEIGAGHGDREGRLRAAASVVFAGNLVAHPEDTEQAAEMTLRAAIDVLDEFKPSRSRKAPSRWAGGEGRPGAFVGPGVTFRSLVLEDWSPLDERKRDEFLTIVRETTPAP